MTSTKANGRPQGTSSATSCRGPRRSSICWRLSTAPPSTCATPGSEPRPAPPQPSRFVHPQPRSPRVRVHKSHGAQSNSMTWRTALPSASSSMPALIPSRVIRDDTSDSTGSLPERHSETKSRNVPRRHGGPEIASDQRSALGDKCQGRQADSGIRMGKPDGDRSPTGSRQRRPPSRAPRLTDRLDHHFGLEVADSSGVHAWCAPTAAPLELGGQSVHGDDPNVVV